MSISYMDVGDKYEDANNKGEIVVLDIENNQIQIKREDGSYRMVHLKDMSASAKTAGCGNISSEKVTDPNHILHRKLVNEMHETYLKKNADYGNSFSEQYEEYGILSAVIRLDDKIRRIKQLMKNGAQVNDESMLDSTFDLSNYALMLAMELTKDSKKE